MYSPWYHWCVNTDFFIDELRESRTKKNGFHINMMRRERNPRSPKCGALGWEGFVSIWGHLEGGMAREGGARLHVDIGRPAEDPKDWGAVRREKTEKGLSQMCWFSFLYVQHTLACSFPWILGNPPYFIKSLVRLSITVPVPDLNEMSLWSRLIS